MLPGAAAELAPHLRHQEGDVQHVQLVGEDVRRKRSGNTMMVS